ncbi:GNAT family N-acetyltransferase [Deinococcus cellulosilyticus]|uniref:N-acetyltransferase domain-containing protein n=1 Tax=Deinococcus cellulosilyticus (strain DSM 18568 / NBRC 106333 / KACC 11606 / 5516J-15) TaxID=1223518 RepID=A0A511MZ22_DEIC1|nr:GNAT family N-acetyltransferase [Deinococcus cellulosilyticus]GEM45834.1 hypothetical protein DC3_14690 [Deinococcus cellulosilyticus NBRC 106333 = KACC 11606]
MTLHVNPTLPEHPDLPPRAGAPAPSVLFGFEENGHITARAALWDSGAVGHFDALSEEGALAVLHAVKEEAQQRGLSSVVGPMNGNTWFKYRLVSDFGDGKPFFGEPWQPSQYLSYFQKAGFQEGWHYLSSSAPSDVQDPRFQDLEEKFRQLGVTVRGVLPEKLEQDISSIHQLSLQAFQGNPFFSPIPEQVFRSLYLPVFQQLPTQFIFLAEHEGRMVGFFLAYPDPLDRSRIIAKTIAVVAERQYAGLGRYLTGLLNRAAQQAGIPTIIHALMHDSNSSTRLSHIYGSEIIRRYVLFRAEF